MLAHSVARHDVQYGEAVPTFQLRRRRAPQASPVTSRRERHSYRPVTCKASGGGSGGDDDVRYGLNLLQWAGKIVPQGAVVTGVKAGWRATWQAMVTELAPQRADGSYARPQSTVRSALLRGARFEPGQLVLFVGNACPWCHRATLVLALRGISSAVRVVKLRDDAERASRGGWVFDPSAPDPLFGKRDLREVYDTLVPGYAGRCTAPLLTDGRRRAPVSNDSGEICRLFNDGFPQSRVDLRPEALRPSIDALNERIYTDVSNAVYQSGFATTQAAYDRAQARLASALTDLDARLGESRFLHGDRVTESDVHLFPTICRFDAVYASLFKCSSQRIRDLPNLQAWLQDVYLLPGVAATMDVDGFRHGYFGQLFPLNPSGIIPAGPTAAQLGLGRDPGRGRQAAAGAGVAAAGGSGRQVKEEGDDDDSVFFFR